MATVLLLSTPVFAHDGATGIVKERMETMKGLGGSMKTIAGMVKKQIPYDKAKAEQAAQTIAAGAEKLLSLFPKDSNPMPSVALSEIWESWDWFTESAQDLKAAAAELVKAAGSGDASGLLQPFAMTGKACSACHLDFRKPKE